MNIAYIGLGSNLGDRTATLREAVRRLREWGNVLAVSSLYETEPVGYLDQSPFINAAVILETLCPPTTLMAAILVIENRLGRERPFRNAPRTLDLDLLLIDDLVLDQPDLILPHPCLHGRAFVLVPLAEIAPAVVHPILERPVSALLSDLDAPSGIALRQGPGWEYKMTHDIRDSVTGA